ncbi:unnamed protein product [Prunus armeniaca]
MTHPMPKDVRPTSFSSPQTSWPSASQGDGRQANSDIQRLTARCPSSQLRLHGQGHLYDSLPPAYLPFTQAPLICTIDHSPTWMDPIIQFLQNQTLPADPAEALRYRSTRYLIINGALYKRGFSLPYLRCLTPEEGNYVIWDIHEGICDNRSGARPLAHKAFIQKYDKCQRFANIPQLAAEPLAAMVSPWPFAQWGLDLIGPMPEGKGQVKYAFVVVNYFTKWAEAKALAIITVARIETFVWQNIVCRFGVPNTIITDNGRQFDNTKFKQFVPTSRSVFASPPQPILSPVARSKP